MIAVFFFKKNMPFVCVQVIFDKKVQFMVFWFDLFWGACLTKLVYSSELFKIVVDGF